MELTTEQNDILRTVSQFDTNIHINAVPGSAKTTTCLYIAKNNPSKRILLLTYNKRLRLETLQRLNGLRNIDCHTFHSFGYSGFVRNDVKMILDWIVFVNTIKTTTFRFTMIYWLLMKHKTWRCYCTDSLRSVTRFSRTNVLSLSLVTHDNAFFRIKVQIIVS